MKVEDKVVCVGLIYDLKCDQLTDGRRAPYAYMFSGVTWVTHFFEESGNNDGRNY